MKGLVVFLSLVGLSTAWDVDPRCPDPHNRRHMMEEAGVLEDASLPEALSYEVDDVEDARDASGLRGMGRNLAESATFSLKMYWEEGFCWQEEYDRHRRWCWECIKDCEAGEELWWQKCNDRNPNQQFVYLPSNVAGRGRFKTAHHNLCLQRVSNVKFVLKSCSNSQSQLIDGYRDDGRPFELMPKGDHNLLINQHHHPKATEVVENTVAKTARFWKTNLMELVNRGSSSGGGGGGDDNTLSLRDEDCRSGDKCYRCEGDCDEDSHCHGDMVCFQRRNSNKNDPVPGCGGSAKDLKDYCVDKNLVNVDPPTDNVPPSGTLYLRNEDCRNGDKCPRCHGDCDNDNQCQGDLVCFQRGTSVKSVPGCSGTPFEAKDYCVDKDQAPQPVDNTPRPVDNIFLNRKVRNCNSDTPCDRCEGDCDKDSDCKGGLKCFQKDGPGEVHGCIGRETSKTDFCYLP